MNTRRALLLCVFCRVLQGLAAAQSLPGQVDAQRIPAVRPHFEPEHTFDAPADSERWTRESPGMHVGVGTTDAIYFRSEVPDVDANAHSWEGTGWRGERLDAVVVVWSRDPIEQVHFDQQDLVGAQGHVLSGASVQLRMVRYVLSNYPAAARNATCDEKPPGAWLLPDRLEPLDRFDLPARTARPVWLSIDIPAGAAPGTYQGALRVAAGNQSTTLRLQVRVQQAVLPPPHDWAFRLDLWQNPWVIAWYYHVRPWSDEHKTLLRAHLKRYADAGGKFITTYAVHSPWQDNSYMIEGGMIEWIKESTGSWRFDYRIFDEYVALAIEAGIDNAITIYTPVPWGNRFRYLDERTGSYVYEEWPPASDAFRTAWRAFLDSLQQHLQRKGWLEKAYLGINENPLPVTMAAIKAIRDHSPKWKITYAGDWHDELDGRLDDYSAQLTKEPTADQLRARSARGFTSTFYVSCFPSMPNTFVFSPPVEARWLGWYAAAHGYDGFLRWAYDAWPADPVRDARHTLWPAGDTFLVYPGADSSIRFEKLREGIVDYEKVRILRRQAEHSDDKDVKRLTGELERSLEAIAGERTFDDREVRALLQGARDTMNELSDRVR